MKLDSLHMKPVVIGLLVLAAALGLWARLAQRDYLARTPGLAFFSAAQLAMSRSVAEGKPFHITTPDADAATQFLQEPGAFTRSLDRFDALCDSARAASANVAHRPYFSDQGGYPVYLFLARKLPGVDSLADAVLPQILLDVVALLLLYPIGLYVSGSRAVALFGCFAYALYMPQAVAVAEPFRDGWPTFAVIFGTAFLIPVWRAGPDRFLRSVGWLAAAGVACGLFTYGRSTAVTVPLTLAILTLLVWRRWVPAAAAGAVLVASALLALTPWMIFTQANARVVSLTSSAGGHALLAGLGEEYNNPLGLRFSDEAVAAYVIKVCGYDVEYVSFPYDAACRREASRFVADHRPWYLREVAKRVFHYVWRGNVRRLKWGFWASTPQHRIGERFLPIAGLLGLALGFVCFPRPWIPLAWVVHFWVFIIPIQSHPRLLLGADWALLLGTGMLLAMLLRLARDRGTWRRRRLRPGRERTPETASAAPAPAGRGFWIVAGAALGIDLFAFLLLLLYPARAPEPRIDWRGVLRTGDPERRAQMLHNVAAVGRDALPVALAGLEDPDPRVQRAAREAMESYRVLMAQENYAEGKIPTFVPPPGVTVDAVADPRTVDGYAMRLRAPAQPLARLLSVGWKHEARGVYVLRLRVWSSTPLLIQVYSEDAKSIRFQQDLVARSRLPMADYLVFEVHYENTFGDSLQYLVLLSGPGVSPLAENLDVRLDGLEIYQDR